MINALSTMKAGISHGTGIGPTEPPIETNLVTASGAEPDGKPFVHSSTQPWITGTDAERDDQRMDAERPAEIAPFSAPMPSASTPTIMQTRTKFMPSP